MCSYSAKADLISTVLNLSMSVISIVIAVIAVIGALYIEEKKKKIIGNIWESTYRSLLSILLIILLLIVLIGTVSFTSLAFNLKWLWTPIIVSFYVLMILIVWASIVFIKK